MEHIAELVEILTCPICKEVLLDKIYQCCNGHIYCDTCINRLKTCSSCAVPMTGKIRALSTEQIRDKLELPCQNHGCKITTINHSGHQEVCEFNCCGNAECNWRGTKKELRKHQKICKYRLIQCLYSECKKSFKAEIFYIHHVEEHKRTYNRWADSKLGNIELPKKNSKTVYGYFIYDTTDTVDLVVQRTDEHIKFSIAIISQRLYQCNLIVRCGTFMTGKNLLLPTLSSTVDLVTLAKISDRNYERETCEDDSWYPDPYFHACLTITPK